MKRWIALAFLLTLLIFVIITAFNDQKEEKAEENTPVNASPEREGMIAPNAPDGLEVGEKAPDFTLETLSGETIHLSDFRGKKVFLNYWATWCPPCREEMPEMQRFQEAYKDEVVILAVNGTGTEKKEEDVKQFVEEEGYTFPILMDKDLEINHSYQILTIPTTYFIGTDGVIQAEKVIGPMTYQIMEEKKDALN
ncbi:Peroxiredoxin [Halobacillus karajensis]|uniref:Stage IV sporulation protein H n=1 Tax=Halobacillus karajensis TaxID=195088 RepID=A0A024P2E5_9BACI|nr:TlpA disulfide reductase family protein [Halobacillus karajensis]CDQ19626.1 Stage IV sporulation protein H [Halobacillus karajensis]CDQ22086.1 Stage IV sporulation protein H [Halobacillus karajensis]CDQ27927.1 Stage IV sporulation protein H [Halobacillus karajensis]SEH79312.1 Peroxiredoxin [Halobacillus karajensis]